MEPKVSDSSPFEFLRIMRISLTDSLWHHVNVSKKCIGIKKVMKIPGVTQIFHSKTPQLDKIPSISSDSPPESTLVVPMSWPEDYRDCTQGVYCPDQQLLLSHLSISLISSLRDERHFGSSIKFIVSPGSSRRLYRYSCPLL